MSLQLNGDSRIKQFLRTFEDYLVKIDGLKLKVFYDKLSPSRRFYGSSFPIFLRLRNVMYINYELSPEKKFFIDLIFKHDLEPIIPIAEIICSRANLPTIFLIDNNYKIEFDYNILLQGLGAYGYHPLIAFLLYQDILQINVNYGLKIKEILFQILQIVSKYMDVKDIENVSKFSIKISSYNEYVFFNIYLKIERPYKEHSLHIGYSPAINKYYKIKLYARLRENDSARGKTIDIQFEDFKQLLQLTLEIMRLYLNYLEEVKSKLST